MTKCCAADGKTPVYNIPGQPLMVRAVDFNAAISLHADVLHEVKNYLSCDLDSPDPYVVEEASALLERVERVLGAP